MLGPYGRRARPPVCFATDERTPWFEDVERKRVPRAARSLIAPIPKDDSPENSWSRFVVRAIRRLTGA